MDTWSQPRRLYVAEFKSGVIKVGITLHAGKARESSLRWHGLAPQRVQYARFHQCGFWAERQLIARMRRIACIARGREWFTGVSFAAAALLAEQVTRQALALDAHP